MIDELDTLFDAAYFAALRLAQPQRAELLAGLAEELVAHLRPKQVLDAGCGEGLLVGALRDLGVEASGVDGSSYALDHARDDVRAHCRRGDVAELEAGDYDLVTCLDVLEHLEGPRTLQALTRLTELAPRVAFASASDEASGCVARPIRYWVDAFAERGFRPVLGVSFSGAPQVMLFERGAGLSPEVVGLYVSSVERACEVRELSAALHSAKAGLEQSGAELRAARDTSAALAAELAELQSSDGAKVGAALRQAKERLLPEGTARHRAFVGARQRLLGAEPPPAPVSDAEPPQPSPRAAFAARYLRGAGLEIGALHFPMPVPAGVEVTYVDRLTREELIARYPELDASAIAAPGLIEDGFSLASVPDGSQGFVIANHVLEHTPNPIRTLAAWSRVLRSGGALLLSVPIARACFDRRRPLTPVLHFLSDQRLLDAGSTAELEARNLEHYREWLRLSTPEFMAERGLDYTPLQPEALEAEARRLQAAGEEIHFHTFSAATFRRLLECVAATLDPTLELLAVEGAGGEVLAALRKR